MNANRLDELHLLGHVQATQDMNLFFGMVAHGDRRDGLSSAGAMLEQSYMEVGRWMNSHPAGPCSNNTSHGIGPIR